MQILKAKNHKIQNNYIQTADIKISSVHCLYICIIYIKIEFPKEYISYPGQLKASKMKIWSQKRMNQVFESEENHGAKLSMASRFIDHQFGICDVHPVMYDDHKIWVQSKNIY